MYYSKGFEYLEYSERIVLLLNRIENKYNFANPHYEELYLKIKSMHDEIDAFLIEMKQETKEEFINFQVNSQLKKFLSSGQIN